MTNPHAEGFLRRYRIPASAFPIIALIDPRTAELLWEHVGAINAATMRVRGCVAGGGVAGRGTARV